MDCFYAAVEMRDNPELVDIPIAIGGSASRRGVISTCNYPARRFGVRSAMATAHALKLCPNLTLLPGRMELYSEISKQIRQIFKRYTDKIEPLSLDEAYLDVSDTELFNGSATLIAEDIRRAIYEETRLTASAGVAPIKFVSKIASDENKPNGLCVISPAKLDDFVKQLPLGKIPGVGKVTLQKLNNLGLFTCEDVRHYELEQLVNHFGKFGPVIWQRSHGIDERGLSVDRKRKSVGVERTLADDIYTENQCWIIIETLLPKLEERLKKSRADMRIQNLGIKLKFSDFQQTTIEHKWPKLDIAQFQLLLTQVLKRREGRGIRLVGLHVTLPDDMQSRQLELPFEE
ncbi:DNA polymerase IV [Alteromonadaceae bacterium M269]|nr:DNA polymerase IV [Alteromonadaceae bacterium M269]